MGCSGLLRGKQQLGESSAVTIRVHLLKLLQQTWTAALLLGLECKVL
ncbi:hypothetical protein LINGRAHAP2_LOCUS26274 [Linum grandiflorum]